MGEVVYRQLSMEVARSESDMRLVMIQAAYGVPSLFLMIFFFVFLGCSNRFSNSFYRLVQFDLITNITCYSNNWIALRFIVLPFGLPLVKGLEAFIPGILTWSNYGMRWFFNMQFCSAAALSIHRITVVLFPYRSEKLWSRYYPVYAVSSAIYSALSELLYAGKTDNIEIFNGVLTNFVNSARVGKAGTLIAALSVAYFVLLSGIGLTTAYLVTKRLKVPSNSHQGIRKKLTRVALTNTVLYLGVLLWSISSALNSAYALFPFLHNASNLILTFASDMITLCLPYILLTFDSNVRNEIGKKLGLVAPTPKVTPFAVSLTAPMTN